MIWNIRDWQKIYFVTYWDVGKIQKAGWWHGRYRQAIRGNLNSIKTYKLFKNAKKAYMKDREGHIAMGALKQ